MKYILKSLNVLTILFHFNMVITKETTNFSSSVSSFERSVPMTLRSVSIAETDEILDIKNNDAVNETIDKTEISTSEFSENKDLNDDTTSELNNSTDESNDEVKDIHSSFNLAIIPSAAVLVFAVIICFKCCKWLRQYTRGSYTDEQFYAVIVTDNDKEYDQIDITSGSTSTAYFDTSSSYTSFLKSSGDGSTLGSIRKWNQDSIKSQNGTSSPTKAAKNVADDEPRITPLYNILSSTETKLDQTNGDSVVMNPSTSSAETLSEQLIDSHTFKRNNRLRVSFNTDVKPTASENRSHNSNIKQVQLVHSSLKKSPSTATSPEHSSPNITFEKPSSKAKKVDVGTQTDKSFRYSIRKSKGHVSDIDSNERVCGRLSTSTLALHSEKNNLKDKCANSLSENSDISKVDTCEDRPNVAIQECRKFSLSTDNPESSKYPLDTNVEVVSLCKLTIESNGDLDLDDDVFIEEEEMKSGSVQQMYKTNGQISVPLQNAVIV